MIFAEGPTAPDALHLDPARAAIAAAYRADERASLEALIPLARLEPERADKSAALARRLVVAVRQGRRAGGLDAFLLSTPDRDLGPAAQKLKRRIQKAGPASAAAST